MIGDMLNLQNKKAMKTDIKVDTYICLSTPSVLSSFPPPNALKLCLLHWSDPGCCGYDVTLSKQGRIKNQISGAEKPMEKPLQQPWELQWCPALAGCCPAVTEHCGFPLQFGKSKDS